MHAIYAVSWADLEGTVQYPLIWHDNDNHTVSAYDVTDYYLQAAHIVANDKLDSLVESDTRTEYILY